MAKIKKTAEELLAELNSTPVHKQMLEKKDARINATKDMLMDEEHLIANKLKEIGIDVNSIFDLVNSKEAYTNAIPTLVDLLVKKRLKQNQIIEGVVRSLAVEQAKGIANKPLLELYFDTNEQNSTFRWAIGNTMEVLMRDEDIEDVIKIVLTPENGPSRQMFVLALAKTNSEKVEDILIGLLEDDEVQLHAIAALGKMKSVKAKSKLEEYAKKGKKVIKKEANKAIKKINK